MDDNQYLEGLMNQVEARKVRTLDDVARDVRSNLNKTVEGIIGAGKALLEGRDLHPSNQAFSKWCSNEFPELHRKQRLRFMQIAHRFVGTNLSHQLSYGVLAELAAPSVPDGLVEQVINAPTPMKVDEVRELKAINRDAPELAEKVGRGEMSLNAANVERKERLAKTFDQMVEDGDIVPQKSNLPIWFNGPKFNPMACAAGVLVGAADLYCSGKEGVGDLKQYLHNRATTGVSKPRDDYQIIALLKLRDAINEIENDLLAYVGKSNQTH